MKNYFNTFKQSMKFNQKFLYVFLIDLLFYLLLFAGFSVWSGALNIKATSVGDLSLLTEIEARTAVAQFFVYAIIYSVLLLIFILLLYSLLKGYIWSLILDKKINFKYFRRFVLLNFVWFLILMLIIIALAYMTKSVEEASFAPLLPILAFLSLLTKHPYFSAVLLLIMLHTTALLQIFFREEPNIKSIKNSFKTFKKFHLFLLYYIFILIPLIIITAVGYALRYLPEMASNIISAIILVVFITWLRFYLVLIVEGIKS